MGQPSLQPRLADPPPGIGVGAGLGGWGAGSRQNCSCGQKADGRPVTWRLYREERSLRDAFWQSRSRLCPSVSPQHPRWGRERAGEWCGDRAGVREWGNRAPAMKPDQEKERNGRRADYILTQGHFPQTCLLFTEGFCLT